jgi:dethiobiotin synthetase
MIGKTIVSTGALAHLRSGGATHIGSKPAAEHANSRANAENK